MFNKTYLPCLITIFLGCLLQPTMAGIVCSNKTQQLASGYSWPGSQSFASNQNCLYKFTWDQNHYATIRVNVQYFSIGDKLEVIDAQGNTVDVVSKQAGLFSQVYPSPGLTIHVLTGPQSTLQVLLSLIPINLVLPSIENSSHVEVSPNSPTHVQTHFTFMKAYVVTAKTKVFMTTVDCPLFHDLSRWSNIFIFEGSGSNATLVGSVSDAKHFVSTGNTITLYTALTAPSISYMLLDDYENVKNVSKLDTAWAVGKDYVPNLVKMDASKGPVALVVGNGFYDDATYVIDMFLSDPNATLSVHSGVNLIDNKLIEYSRDVGKQMPQQFPVTSLTTFVLNKGKALLNLTTYDSTAGWTEARVGREGVLMSWNYGSLSSNQSIDSFRMQAGWYGAVSLVTYEISYLKGFVDPNALVNIYVKGHTENTYTVKMTDLVHNPVSYVGNLMKVDYATSNPSKGVMLKFNVQNGSSFKFGIISAVLAFYSLCM